MLVLTAAASPPGVPLTGVALAPCPLSLAPRPWLLQVYSVPLVGVWVRSPGVRSASHPLAVAAAAKFALGGLLPDRAAQQPGGAFLLLLFPGGALTPPACPPLPDVLQPIHAYTPLSSEPTSQTAIQTCTTTSRLHDLLGARKHDGIRWLLSSCITVRPRLCTA